MVYLRKGKSPRLIGACIAGLAWTLISQTASAQDAPAIIQSVHVAARTHSSVVDIAMTKATAPTLRDEGNRLVVTLPHAIASPNLTDHLTAAGLVSGIGIEDGVNGSMERITLVLRSPAIGKLAAASDKRSVQVIVAPPGSPALALTGVPKSVLTRPRLSFRLPKVAALPPASVRPAALCSPVSLMPAAFSTHKPAAIEAEPAVIPSAQRVAGPAALPSAQMVATPLAPPVRLYNVNAYQSDLAGILSSLAQEAQVSIVMEGAVSSKVTMSLRQAPLVEAVDMLTKAAGLSYHQDGNTFVIGDAKELAAAYPPPAPIETQEVYRCLHVSATDLVSALKNTFDKDRLRVSVGAAPFTPHLDDSSTEDVTGIQSSGTTKGSQSVTPGADSHMIVLAGDQSIVAQALDLAKKLDVRRAQVKIGVQITDIDRSALKDLGLQYTFGSFGLQESQPSGIGFGKFTRSPLSVSATISALETSGDAKLLAAPNMTLLDGEQGYILIGDRLQFPQLIGYTPAQTPIYNVTEERVGIYLQLAVHMEDNGEITLTIYPQVSTVTGYLNINGASYPQISTREQQTTVRVKDGQQIVVGGLIQDEEIKNIQKVPILSDIPILRELFTYRDTTKQQTEVVILITPQILKG